MDLESQPNYDQLGINKINSTIVGDWVAVIYDNQWYPGVIVEIIEDKLRVKWLFFWPKNQDVIQDSLRS